MTQLIRRRLLYVACMMALTTGVYMQFTRSSAQLPAARIDIAPQPNARTTGRVGAELQEVRAGRLLADGSFVVADGGDMHLHHFNQHGLPIRDYGRTGDGPGEIETIVDLLRCGDTLVVIDVGGNASLFTENGQFVRRFRFAAHPSGTPPRQTACNSRMQFVHTGWTSPRDAKPGRFRGSVPLWTTSSVPRVEHTLGSVPGSESVLLIVNGTPRGTRPQPMGFEQLLALGHSTLWTLDTERNVAVRRTLQGDSTGTFRIESRRISPSAPDIEAAMEEENGGNVTSSVRAAYASLDFTKPLPSATRMLLDDRERLWLELARHADQSFRTWSIHDVLTIQTRTLTMPAHWALLDVRGGAILIRAINDDGTEEVRLHRLSEEP